MDGLPETGLDEAGLFLTFWLTGEPLLSTLHFTNACFLELWLSSRIEKALDVEISALLGEAERHLFLESSSTKSLWGDGKVPFPSEEETLLDLPSGLIAVSFLSQGWMS